MGPFYCPSDQGIYIDTDFFREMEQKLGAGGDFARVYVMAHEYGHHVQALTGVADQIRSAQQSNPAQANRLQVAMELQADCYAGVRDATATGSSPAISRKGSMPRMRSAMTC